jgi:6-phosphogluconolactonase
MTEMGMLLKSLLRRRIAMPLLFTTAILVWTGFPAFPSSSSAVRKDRMMVYIGTYTGERSQGIYLLEFNSETGTLRPVGVAADVANPSFLAIHPNRRFLYAVNEVGEFSGMKTGAVSAFAIHAKTGLLTLLNQQSSGGSGPCHISLDKQGRYAFVANYGSGSVAALPIEEDGRLAPATGFVQHAGSSVNPSRQEGPHAHSINPDPAGRFVIAADLGLDRLLVYRFDPKRGDLAPNDPPYVSVAPGAGPRHFAFHPNGRFGYVINELANTVTAFQYDAKRGVLTEIQTISALPEGYTQTSYTSEVVVHPSGKFLYGSNRGHDSIVIYAIEPQTGRLSLIGHQPTGGRTPRNFALDPAGKFLLAANQNSDNIVVFRIDAQTGKLEQVGDPIAVPTPVCIRFLRR